MMAAEEQTTTVNLTRWIMLAVLGWGLLLALGTYLFGGNQPLLRAVIVAGCTLGFLGLWLAALVMRQQRMEQDDE
jgi:high-affinity Fe2+/Pb2+ permease